MIHMAGCGGPVATGSIQTFPVTFWSDPHLLSLQSFASLPDPEQARRRARGADLLAQSRGASRTRARLELLGTAVVEDPGLAGAWLDLASLLRWVGEDARTDIALVRAAEAIASPNGPVGIDKLQALNRRLSLLRAWYHYDRGEWRLGYRWAKTFYDQEPGDDAARVITGLLEARLGNAGKAWAIANDIRRTDSFATEPDWINACVETARGLDRAALSFVLGLRPRGEFQTECWNDMALIAERLGEWSFAERWYREARASLPLNDPESLGQIDHARLGPGPRSSAMPVWLGLQGAYVTGSLSSYTAMARERFRAAASGPDRDKWAGETVNAAGICLRLGLDELGARKARGLVFAATDNRNLALSDLRRAAQESRELGRPDAEVEAALGHQLILAEDFPAALSHLQDAVALDPAQARTWSDLGLVQVTLGDQEAADRALSRAIELDPTLAVAWFNRGLMAMHQGDRERAEADLTEAARLAPDNSDIARLLEKLQGARSDR